MFLSVFAIFSLFGLGAVVVSRINTTIDLTPSADYQSFSATNYSNLFSEEVIFELNNPCQVNKYIGVNDNLKVQNTVTNCQLPSTVSFSGTNYSFPQKTFLIINNPAKDIPFYKVEVTLTDDGISDQRAFLTLIDNLWGASTLNAIVAGINTTATQPNGSKTTYWYDHTKIYPQSPASQSMPQNQKDFDTKVKNALLNRRSGDIKLEIYVTPKGSYAMIDGKNTASFPNLYSGSYLFDWNKFNYIVLSKNDASAAIARFKNLKITKLPNPVVNTQLVNAYFMKSFMDITNLRETPPNYSCVTSEGNVAFNPGVYLGKAFNIRAYDYYFHENHSEDIKWNVDVALKFLQDCVDVTASSYGKYNTTGLNHDGSLGNSYLSLNINRIQALTSYLGFVSDVLTSEQLRSAQISFAKAVDITDLYYKGIGMENNQNLAFFSKEHYRGDSFMEEVSWITNYYTSYLRFFKDVYREQRLKDLIHFGTFHTFSQGDSIGSRFPDFKFSVLPDEYLRFASRYIHDTGEIDNHGFHPSVTYGSNALLSLMNKIYVMDILKMDTRLPKRNISQIYGNSYNLVNNKTLKLNTFLPQYEWKNGKYTNEKKISEDIYYFDNSNKLFAVTLLSKPSGLEDWGSSYTNYHGFEALAKITDGNLAKANENAASVYYLFYNHGILGVDNRPTSTNKISWNQFSANPYSEFWQRDGYNQVSLPNVVSFIDSKGDVNPKFTDKGKEYGYKVSIKANKAVESVIISISNISKNDKAWSEVVRKNCGGKSCDIEWLMNTPIDNANYYLKTTLDYSDGTSCTSDPYKYDYTLQNDFCGIGGFMAFRNGIDMVGTTFTSSSATAVDTKIPNCSNLAGPSQIKLGETATYTADFSSAQGKLRGEIVASQNASQNLKWAPGQQNMSGTSGSLSLSWKPTEVGTYDVFCRAWNDGIAECRGNASYVDSAPRYSCAGPTSSLRVNVVAAGSGSSSIYAPTIVMVSGTSIKRNKGANIKIVINDRDTSDVGKLVMSTSKLPAGLYVVKGTQQVIGGKVVAEYYIKGTPSKIGIFRSSIVVQDPSGKKATRSANILVR